MSKTKIARHDHLVSPPPSHKLEQKSLTSPIFQHALTPTPVAAKRPTLAERWAPSVMTPTALTTRPAGIRTGIARLDIISLLKSGAFQSKNTQSKNKDAARGLSRLPTTPHAQIRRGFPQKQKKGRNSCIVKRHTGDNSLTENANCVRHDRKWSAVQNQKACPMATGFCPI